MNVARSSRGVVWPAPLDLLPAADVEPRIRLAHAELADLERELEHALAEAEALEAAAGRSSDVTTYQFVATRLRAFLDSLRLDANADFSTLLRVAETQVDRHAPRPTLATRSSLPAPLASSVAMIPRPEVEAAPAEPPCVAPTRVAMEPFAALAADAASEFDPPPSASEDDFWSDEPERAGARRHVVRMVRAVAFQAGAVLLAVSVVLVRIG